MAEISPLTENDFTEIKFQLEQLKVAEGEIKRAELAGIDVAQHKRDLAETRLRLSKLKQAYFPNRS